MDESSYILVIFLISLLILVFFHLFLLLNPLLEDLKKVELILGKKKNIRVNYVILHSGGGGKIVVVG
jgi:hypothetical protein